MSPHLLIVVLKSALGAVELAEGPGVVHKNLGRVEGLGGGVSGLGNFLL